VTVCISLKTYRPMAAGLTRPANKRQEAEHLIWLQSIVHVDAGISPCRATLHCFVSFRASGSADSVDNPAPSVG
jgi:hypothetical protein